MSRLFAEALKGGTSEGSPRPGQTGSPTLNRTVDDLRRQLLKVKGDLEAEKQKTRQLTRSNAVTLKEKKDDLEKKHRQAMEQAVSRKDQEKVNELKLLEDRLTRQKEMEVRKLQREKNDEVKEAKTKLIQEHELKLRSAVDAERQRLADQYGGEDPNTARESKLAREVFMRTEECESAKSQVRGLREENRNLLEQLRQMQQSHEASLAQLQKQGKVEAAREVARLQLAERRLMEREQEVSDVEQRMGYTEMEKKDLLEMIEKLKGALEAQQKQHLHEVAASPSSHAHSQLQKRCSELEASNRKLEEQGMDQRQEIAGMRKKLSVASSPSRPSSSLGASSTEDLAATMDSRQLERKLHDYRRRNKELLTLAKQLDGRLKALQIENESLMESKNRNTTETEKMLRKQFVKQQIKDREEHKRELRAKDREVDRLKAELDGVANQVARAKQVEAESAERKSVESNFKVLSRERLQLELFLAKVVRSIPERDAPQIHVSEMVTSKKHLETLEADNEQMKSELAKLRQQLSKYVDSDSELENRAMKQQVESLKRQLEQQASDADADVSQLTAQLKAFTAEKCAAEEKCSELTAQVDLLKSSSDEGEKTVAELASLNQKIREAKKECDVLQKSLSEASEAQHSSEVECKKLRKEVSRVKELRELVKTKEEEKLQLEEQLDMVKGREESMSGEVDQLQVALKELAAEKEGLEASRGSLQAEVKDMKKQLGEQKLAAETFEVSLKEANNRSRELGAELERVKQQREEAQRVVRATPSTSTKEVQCDLLPPTQPLTQQAGDGRAPTTSSPKLGGRSPLDSQVPEVKPRSPLMAAKTKSTAGVTANSAPKEVPKQGRSVSVPTIDHSASWDMPKGRHSIASGPRNVRPPRPKSGGGRRSAGGINRGLVPPYILAAQGGSLQSELMSAGEHIDDVFDSEAVNITESELIDDLETTQSNISLDGYGFDGDTLPRNNLPSPTKHSAASLPGGEGRHVSSLESPDSPVRGPATKLIHQLPGGSTEDDIIEVRRGLARVEEESPSSASLGEDKERDGNTDSLRHQSQDSSPAPAVGFSPSPVKTPPGPVAMFKAAHSYDPVQMSPNPDHSSELALQKGQVLVVFGNMREDGFYVGDSNGQRGLVPSNFVEKIRNLTEEEVLKSEASVVEEGKSVKTRLQWGSQEVALKEAAATKHDVVYPPSDLVLERQFVDQSSSNTYKAVISWTPPTLVPAVAEAEYRVYVNRQLRTTVPASEDTKVLLSELPLHEMCSIVVRTAAGQEESADPASPLVIGAKFPPAPVDLALKNDATSGSLVLSWRDGAHTGTSLPPATHYSVSVNGVVLTEVEASNADEGGVCSILLDKEMLEPAVGGKTGEWHYVAMKALHNGLESPDSEKIRISPLMLKKVFVARQGGKDMTASQTRQNGHSPKMADKGGAKSLLDYAADADSEDDSEDEEEAGGLPQGAVGQPVANILDLVDIDDDDSVSDGEGQVIRSREVITNLLEVAGEDEDEDVSIGEAEPVMFPQPRYYRALSEYNPRYMSENTGREDEELGFMENDIIQVIGMEDTDWLIGRLRGHQGVVPVNLITEITDPQEIKRLGKEFSSVPAPPSQHRQEHVNGQADTLNSTGRKMRAIYDYDPVEDSPNGPEAAIEELQFYEGDVIVVFGDMDDAGFYTGALGNKRGLVPSNFLTPLDPSSNPSYTHNMAGLNDLASDDDESDIDTDSDIQMFSLSTQVQHGHGIAQGVAN